MRVIGDSTMLHKAVHFSSMSGFDTRIHTKVPSENNYAKQFCAYNGLKEIKISSNTCSYKSTYEGFPGSSVVKIRLQRRRCGFDLLVWKSSRDVEQLSTCATSTELNLI